jgi:maleylpyruvate isomerase
MDDRTLDDEIAGCAAAHQRLLADADGWLADPAPPDVAAPSLLPGWTIGHVLSHLARNADSHRIVLEAACRGESANRYPGGRDQRNGDIDAGAPRPLAEQVADVRRTIWSLEQAWAVMTPEAWSVVGYSMDSTEVMSELPFRRWREVEVHHADLGLPGFTMEDWSPEYVRRELRLGEMAWDARQPMGLTGLPPAAKALPPVQRLAWLAGRLDVPGLPHVPPWW